MKGGLEHLFVIDKNGNILEKESFTEKKDPGEYSVLRNLIAYNIKKNLLGDINLRSSHIFSPTYNVFVSEVSEDVFGILSFHKDTPVGKCRDISGRFMDRLRGKSYKPSPSDYIPIQDIADAVIRYYRLSNVEKKAVSKNREKLIPLIDSLAYIYAGKISSLGAFSEERKENLRQGYLAFATMKIDRNLAEVLIKRAIHAFKEFKLNPWFLNALLHYALTVWERLISENLPDKEDTVHVLRAFKKGTYLTMGASVSAYLYTKVGLIEENIGLNPELIFKILSVNLPENIEVPSERIEEIVKKLYYVFEISEGDLELAYSVDAYSLINDFRRSIKKSEILKEIYSEHKDMCDGWLNLLADGLKERKIDRNYWESIYLTGLSQKTDYRFIYTFLRLQLVFENEAFKNLSRDRYRALYKLISVGSCVISMGFMERIHTAFRHIADLPERTVVRMLDI